MKKLQISMVCDCGKDLGPYDSKVNPMRIICIFCGRTYEIRVENVGKQKTCEICKHCNPFYRCPIEERQVGYLSHFAGGPTCCGPPIYVFAPACSKWQPKKKVEKKRD